MDKRSEFIIFSRQDIAYTHTKRLLIITNLRIFSLVLFPQPLLQVETLYYFMMLGSNDELCLPNKSFSQDDTHLAGYIKQLNSNHFYSLLTQSRCKSA